MKTRERREARAERLREWAEKREQSAAAVLKSHEKYRGDYAFNTQPGHIPERARVIRQEDAAFQSINKAASMDARAASIEHELDKSIYSDDDNATEALEARIAENEARRKMMRDQNAYYRKHKTMKGCPGVSDATAAGLDADIPTRYSWEQKGPWPAYSMSNLGSRIQSDKKRLAFVKIRQGRASAAEANNGMAAEFSPDRVYVTLTFAEKPARGILDALRETGFHWSGGSWHGRTENLPECVKALVQEGGGR